MQNKKTLIIGASPKPERYSYKAHRMLQSHGHDTVLVGSRPGELDGKTIQTGEPKLDDIHTVTLYVNPQIQEKYYPYILNLKPQRVIFNPGTENDAFYDQCNQAGIEAIEACTLVLLSTNQF